MNLLAGRSLGANWRVGGDGPSLTFAKIEALVAERNVVAMDSRACRGKYDLCGKQTGSKGKEISRLWPKLHERLTTGAETPGYAVWMGFAGLLSRVVVQAQAKERGFRFAQV